MARLRLHPFRPRLLDALNGYTRRQLLADVSAGLTVGIVALPLAMAFAIASGVKPEQGLVTAIVAGLLISAFGGSNVQIGGPAGAFIVVVYAIVERHGLTNLLIATALAGVLLFAMGALRLGALVRHIPIAIVIGFTNGIAVLIALAQLKDLLGLELGRLPADFASQIGAIARHIGDINPAALGLGLASLALVAAWPRNATPASGRLRRLLAHLPASIVVLLLSTLAAVLLALPVETIGSRFGGIPQSLPRLDLPPVTWAGAQQLLIPTLTIALLGAVESLLCARVADGLTELPRHDPNQELMAQGIANMVAPAFGGIPATGTVARTMTNVRAGGRSPVAGIVHALTLLAVVLAAAPLARHVPLAALAGILLFVAWSMGEWHEFARLRRLTLPYRVTLLGTFFLTVVFDLMVAVEAGLVLACGFFIWRMAALFKVDTPDLGPLPPGVALRRLYGALFFGAVDRVEALADALPAGTRALVLDARLLVSLDFSGADALRQLQRDLRRRGIGLWIAGLNEQPRAIVARSDLDAQLGAEALADDLETALARAADAAAAPASP